MKRALFALVCILLLGGSAAAQTTIFNGVVKDLTQAAISTGQVTFTLKPGIDATISGNARFVSSTATCEIHNPLVLSTSGTATITVVVNTAQNWQVGDNIIFAGTTDSTLNSSSATSPYTITQVNSTTSFNFLQTGTHNNGAGGTVGGLYKSGGTGACAVTQNTALNPANTYYSVSIWPIFSLSSTFNTYAIGNGPVDISTIVPTPGQQPAYSFVDTFSNQNITGQKSFPNGMTVTGGTFNSPTINTATFGASTWNSPLINTPTIANPTFTTQPIVLGGLGHIYNIAWTVPAADRSLTVSDPFGNDTFTFNNASQTIQNKILSGGIILGTSIQSIHDILTPTMNGVTLGGNGGNFNFPAFLPAGQIVDSIGRTVAVTTTPLLTVPTVTLAQYSIVQCLRITAQVITSVAGTGTTVSLTLTWTDQAAQTVTTSNANLNVLGSNAIVTQFVCALPGSTINYATTVGAIGTSQYRIRIFTEAF